MNNYEAYSTPWGLMKQTSKRIGCILCSLQVLSIMDVTKNHVHVCVREDFCNLRANISCCEKKMILYLKIQRYSFKTLLNEGLNSNTDSHRRASISFSSAHCT